MDYAVVFFYRIVLNSIPIGAFKNDHIPVRA